MLKAEVLDARQQELIWKAIRVRNWLVHEYWNGARTWRIVTPEGRGETVEELERTWRFLRGTTAIVHEMIDRYLAACGQSIQRYMDQAAAMWEGDIELPVEKELIH